MAQFNYMSVRESAGRGDEDRQRYEANALAMRSQKQRMSQSQQAFDEQTQLRNTQWLESASGELLALAQSNPGQYERLLPQVIGEGVQRGILDESQIDPRRITPEVLSDINQRARFVLDSYAPQQSPIPLQKSTPYRVRRGEQDIVITPTFDPRTGQTDLVESPYEGQVLSTLGETPTERSEREITTAGGKAGATNEQKRASEIIEVGQRQADATAILRRGIQLLDLVETGRPEQIALAARNLFGIAGADETELNANLGKAVLSQLRQTFGAQFTQQEGERLESIEANFGKSTAGNRRLLEQALKVAERAARRGIDVAQRNGMEWEAQEIQRALDYEMNPEPNDDAESALNEAREAIAAGASREAVAARLREMGIDPGNL